MKLRIFALAAAVAMVLAATSAAADYVQEGGFFWKDGVAYAREKDWFQTSVVSQYWNGCSYVSYPTYRWDYTWKYSRVQLHTESPDIERDIIKLAAARDAQILKAAAANQKSQAALALIDKLGLAGNYNVPAYGTGLFPVAGNTLPSLQLSAAGVQGNTIYGYGGVSYNSQTQSYGNNLSYGAGNDTPGLSAQDLMVLMQMVGRTTDTAQQWGGQAQADLSQRVKEFGHHNARVAEINARRDMALAIIQASQPQPSTKTSTTITGVGPAPLPPLSPAVPVPAAAAKVDTATWLRLPGPQKCVACHGADKKKGGFDISQYHPSITPAADKARVLAYILPSKPDAPHCPKDGVTLTAEELASFITDPAVGPMPPAKP